MQIPKPKNQWALAVYLLAENKNKGLTNADATKSDTFYKFQVRLNEVMKGREDKIKVIKLWCKFKNRFNHNGRHINYKSLASHTYLCRLIEKLNRDGAKAISYPKSK
jgi:hypothetical protein